MENNNNNGNGTRTMLYNRKNRKCYLVLRLSKEEQDRLDEDEDLNKSQRIRKFYLTLKKRTEEKSTSISEATKKWQTYCIDLENLKQDENDIQENSTDRKTEMDTNTDKSTDVDTDRVDIGNAYTKLGKYDDVFEEITEYLNESSKNIENKIDYSYRIYRIDKKWFDEETKKRMAEETGKQSSPEKSSFRVGYELFFSRVWLGLITPCIVITWFAPSAFKFLENVFADPAKVFTVWDGFNNPLYNFANAIFCCSGVLGIGLSLMAVVGLFSSQEEKKKRRDNRENVSEFKWFSKESALSVFALIMTGCYATQTVMNMTAQGILPIVTNPLACVPAVFAILGFAFSAINLALRIKDKVELGRFNKSSKLNKSNENNGDKQFVDLTKGGLVVA